jgi:hypothetical protein
MDVPSRRRTTLLPAAAGWIIGMLVAFHPVILSGFAAMQGDWADSRFNNYVLEHGYRWLVHSPGHERFWSPPMFFPVPNTAAYSDVLLGVAPFYWPWRALGIPPDTSFQLWMLTVATVNYLAAFALFSRGFRCRPLAAAVGATLYSFASVRIEQLIHPQLVSQFYLAIAILALLRLFDSDPGVASHDTTPLSDDRWIYVLAGACVGQLYSSYYNAWFLSFALLLAALGAVLFADGRRRLSLVVRTHARAICVSVAGAAIAVAPLAIHYSRAAHQVGMRNFWTVEAMLPRIQSWAYLGPGSWLYGAFAAHPIFHFIPMEHEQRLGAGVATTLFAVLGLWSARHRRVVQFVTAVPLAMALIATQWPGGFTAWRAVYAIVPGAAALRAVSRIGMAIVLPIALGVALLIDQLTGGEPHAQRLPRAEERWAAVTKSLLAAIILVAVFLEQGQQLPSYGKLAARARTTRVANAVGPQCAAFLSTIIGGKEDPWRYHVDAMWASMQLGTPTINGYSGNQPPGWKFYDIRIHPGDGTLIPTMAEVEEWAARWRLNPNTICMLRVPPG